MNLPQTTATTPVADERSGQRLERSASASSADLPFKPHVYFPSIDGLRAIAVVSVVLYHISAAALPGGFVGVDLFFVISGFVVIASIGSLDNTSFVKFFAAFYARRIIRILPALIVTLVATGLLAAIFIPKAWLSSFTSKTGLYALFGASNIVLAFNDESYFTPRTEFNPFTHTWSLGVEEQYYFVIPPLLYLFALARYRSGFSIYVKTALAVLSVASLFCCYVWTKNDPRYAFYLLPARFWELGAGALLYVTSDTWMSWLSRWRGVPVQLFAIVAAALLAGALLFSDPARFPFPWALLVVVAGCVSIATTIAWPQLWLSRWMSNPAVTWVGRISYSLYLWHWPILVMFRWTVGLDSFGEKIAAAVLSFVMAVVSYYCVEQPFRTAGRKVSRARWRVIGVGLASVAVGFLALKTFDHFQPRLSASVTKDTALWYPDAPMLVKTTDGCEVSKENHNYNGGKQVDFRVSDCSNVRKASLFVIGDSHAAAYERLVGDFAGGTRENATILTWPGCQFLLLPQLASTLDAVPGCHEFVERASTLLQGAKAGDVVFLPALRVLRFRDQWGSPNPAPPSVGLDEQRKAIDEAVAVLSGVTKRGVSVVLEAPKPVFESPPFRCSDWFNRSSLLCSYGLRVQTAQIETLRKGIMDAMNEVASRVPRVSIWDPLPVLCQGGLCDAYRNGKPLFFDGDHLSGYGNQVLLPSFEAYMRALSVDTLGG